MVLRAGDGRDEEMRVKRDGRDCVWRPVRGHGGCMRAYGAVGSAVAGGGFLGSWGCGWLIGGFLAALERILGKGRG